jgi:protein-S-isoprenylcysteine O-methyltransferase Ste14
MVTFYFDATSEEKIMELKFGNEYRTYQMKTGTWFPKVR